MKVEIANWWEKDHESIRGSGSVRLVTDGITIELRNVRLVEGKNGLFIGMPSQKKFSGEGYTDMVYIPDREQRREFEKKVMDAIDKHLGKTGGNEQENATGQEDIGF